MTLVVRVVPIPHAAKVQTFFALLQQSGSATPNARLPDFRFATGLLPRVRGGHHERAGSNSSRPATNGCPLQQIQLLRRHACGLCQPWPTALL